MGIISSVSMLLASALSVYSWMILIRILLSWVNPDPYNPVVRFLVRATDPVLEPLRRMIPPIAGLDLSPIVALLGISLLQRLVTGLAQNGMHSGAFSAVFVEILSLLHLVLTFYLLLLFVRSGLHIHAWLTFRRGIPYRLNLNNPVIRFVFQSTEYIVRSLRRWVPNCYGMDITPMVAALGLIFFLSLLQDMSLRVVSL